MPLSRRNHPLFLRNTALVGLAVFALLGTTFSSAATATADGARSISGIVTVNGDPVEGATVSAFDPADDTTSVAEIATGADGAYTLGALADGGYKVRFQADGATEQWWDSEPDFADADEVDVTTADATDINADLSSGPDCSSPEFAGNLSGIVYQGADDASPLADASIAVHNDFGDDEVDLTTGEDGSYSTDCLRIDSDYTITATAPELASVTIEGVHLTDATAVVVDPIHLTSGQTLAGTVTSAKTSAPLSGIEVVVEDANENQLADVSTGDDGTYSVPHLANSNVYVHFLGGDDFASQWYKNASTRANATPLAMTADRTADAILAPAASITGTVSGKKHGTLGAISGVSVELFTSTGEFVKSRQTADDGSYNFGGLTSGSYKVHAAPAGSNGDAVNWLDAWYSGKHRLGAATVIKVTSTTAAVAKNLTLTRAASIGGTLTEGGEALDGSVDLLDLDGKSIASTSTDFGNYSFTGLSAGAYKLRFESEADSGSYAVAYFPLAPNEQLAEAIVLTTGQAVTGEDADLPASGGISGSVVDAASDGIANATVSLFTADGLLVETDEGESDGEYGFHDLLAGEYTLKFAAPGYVSEWWQDSSLRSHSAIVDVATGDTLDLDGAELAVDTKAPLASSISGTVKDSAGAPIEGAAVYLVRRGVEDLDNPFLTDADGVFRIARLVPGTYSLRFDSDAGGSNTYLTQYWKNRSALATVDTFIVKANQDVTGKNAVLVKPATVSGTVSAGGEPTGAGEIEFYTTKGAYIRSTPIDSDEGTFTTPIAPGTYKMRAVPFGGSSYGPTWAGNKTSFGTSSTITVGEGSALAKNIALAKTGGTISGTVTAASDKLPLDGAGVILYQKDPDGTYRNHQADGGQLGTPETTETSGTGAYKLSHLAAGSYKLAFGNGFATLGYARVYYGGKSSLASSPSLTVKTGSTTKAKTAAVKTTTPVVQLATPMLSVSTMSGLVGVESDFVTSPATGVKFAFQWYRDGVALKGKTQFVYLEKSPDIGKDITLRITASKAGYKSTAQFSNAVVWHGTTGP